MASPLHEAAGQADGWDTREQKLHFPFETFIRCAKQSKNACTTDIATENGKQCIELPTTHIPELKILHTIVVADGPVDTSLRHVTTETDIDTTAELLPSGGTQSHHHAMRTTVSESSPQPRLTVCPTTFNDNIIESSSPNKHLQGKPTASTIQPFCFGISSGNQKKKSISLIVQKGSKFVTSEDGHFIMKESVIGEMETSTSRNLKPTFVDSQKIDFSNQPSEIKSIAMKEPNREIFNQPNRMQSTASKMPKGPLDIGESAPPASVTTDLYSDINYTSMTLKADVDEKFEGYLSDLFQNMGDDCYTNLGLPEEKKILLLKYTEQQVFHSNINLYNGQDFDDKEKEIKSVMEQPNDSSIMPMVGHILSTTEPQRKLPGMEFISENRCPIGSTETMQYPDTCHGKVNNKRAVLMRAEHPNGPLGQFITVSPGFMYPSTSYESCVTSDITQSCVKTTTQNYSHVAVDHKNSSVDLRNVDINQQVDGLCANVNQPEDKTCFKDKEQESHICFNNVNNKKEQEINTGNNSFNLTDQKTCSKANDDRFKASMIADLRSIKKNLFNQGEPTSPDCETNKAGDVTLLSSSKTLSHDSNVNRSKLANQLTPVECSPEEMLPSSFKDTEEYAHIYSNNADDNVGHIGGNKTDNKVRDEKTRMLFFPFSMDSDTYHAKMQKELPDRRVTCVGGNVFQNNVNGTTDLSEDRRVRQSHFAVAELSSSPSQQCTNTSSGPYSVFTESREERSDMTLHNYIKTFQQEDIDPDANKLVDDLFKKIEPPDGHLIQVSLNSVNSVAMQHVDHENDITLKEEQITNSVSSHNKMSEIWEMKLLKENSENNVTYGIALHTESSQGNKDSITSSEQTGNGNQLIINAEFECITPDQNDSIKSFGNPVHQYISSYSDPSDLCTTTSPDPAYHCTPNCSDPSCLCTITSDPPYQSITTSPDPPYQCTTTSPDPPYQSTTTSPDPPYQCTTTFPDPPYQYKTTSPDPLYQSTTTSPDPSYQCTTTSPDPSYQCTTTSPDLSYQCTTTSPEPPYQCTTTFPDPPYHSTTTSPDSSYQCTTTSPDPSYQCTTTSPDLSYQCTTTSPDPPYQSTTTSPDPSYQCTTTSPDLSYQYKTTSPDPLYQSTTTSPDPSYQCTTTSPDPSYQCTTTSPDLSYQCTTTSPEPPYQCTTTSPDPPYQNKATSPDPPYQSTTTSPDPSYQCTTTSPDPSYQCTTTSPDLSYQCTTTSPDPPYQCTTNCSDTHYQFTTTSPDPAYHCTPKCSDPSCLSTITSDPPYQSTTTSPDPPYQSTATSRDPPYQSTTTFPDPPYQSTTTSPDSPYQCTTTSPAPFYQCTTTSPDLPYQCTTNCSDPPYQFTTNCSDTHYQCTTNYSDPSCLCTINSDPPYQYKPTSPYLSYQCTTTTPDPSYQCTITSPDPPYHDKSTSTFYDSSYQYTLTIPNPSYQCKTTSPDLSYQCTMTSPDSSYQCTTTSFDPSYQCRTISPDPSYQCTTNYSDLPYHCTTTSPVPSYQCTTTSPDPSYQCTTISTDLSYHSTATSADFSYQCTDPSPDPTYQNITITPDSNCQCATTTPAIIPDPCYQRIISSSDLFSQCPTTFPAAQLNSIVNETCGIGHMVLRRSVRVPIQDEYGNMIKQNEHYFLEELRKIFLDQQGKGLTLVDSGIVLTKTVNHLEKNITLVTLWNGSELGMVIANSKLFLYYHLEKHFYVTEQLNEDWYFAQDRITKVNMLMKKVPVTSNWLKSLHHFLCLQNHPRLLMPYAVIADRNGSILFLMEDRHVLGVGTRPLGYVWNTAERLLELLHFLRYCRTCKLLPRNLKDSILYTEQGIFFDPSSLYNNDDLCELRKCLKDSLLCFLCNGQQEYDRHSEVLLERAFQLLEEDCPAQINPTSLIFSSQQGPVPFCFPSFLNED